MTGSQPKKKSGFTLIELLITIGVISILASAVAIVMPGQLKKARDTQRKSDLARVQKALVLYYQDKGHYPCTELLLLVHVPLVEAPLYELVPPGSCAVADDGLSSYINPIPVDPKASVDSFSCTTGQFVEYGYVVSELGEKYELFARLETIKEKPYIFYGVPCYNYKVETP
jgi:prepilin-type N-terminal cleavage/methylation domain-containing protein